MSTPATHKDPERCFICERVVLHWVPPYVELTESIWVHWVCWINARTTLVQED